MAATTFTVTPDYVTGYLNGSAGARLQLAMDDALYQAKADAVTAGVSKSITINIAPNGAVNAGASLTINWSQENCREYLEPPGDSRTYQAAINANLISMGRSAVNNNTITSVIIQVAAT